MSNIFDALQRSESESSQTESAAQSEATELLRRAERRASSSWETAVHHKKIVAADSTNLGVSLGVDAAEVVVRSQIGELSDEKSADGKDAIFSQFASLPLSLDAQNRLVTLGDSEGPAAEAFRLLGVRLRNLRRERPLKKLLITSTVPREGKSMVAANLACTLALTTQHKILLLEGDLRRPSLAGKFGIGKSPGLIECLRGERALKKCIYRIEDAKLWILPAGFALNNPLELLQSSQLAEITNLLTEWFDWIIIDSPPVLPLGDTSVWARMADGILLVTRQGTTEKKHLLRGLEALEPKKLIGALLNCSQNSSEYGDYYRMADASRPTDVKAS